MNLKKAGFTKKSSTQIAPPMVGESVASLECRVNEIKSLGQNGGAGQLVLAEILCIHVDDTIINDGKIDQQKITHVTRLGGDWYAKISPANLFQVRKPKGRVEIGVDALPESIKTSEVLTGNHLAQLAGVSTKPRRRQGFKDERMEAIATYFKNGNLTKRIHAYAIELIEENKIEEAWQVLLHV